MKKIELTQGKYAIVDNEDYIYLSKFSWYFSGSGYAARKIRINGKQKMFYMHRVIAGTPKGKETDHINLNKLDNRNINLRICTRGQNRRNVPKRVDNRSGFKGVSFHKRDKKWQANIHINGSDKWLGYFATKIEAALAYNKTALKHFGVYARINNIN